MTEPRDQRANSLAAGRRLFEETQTKEGRDAKRERDRENGEGSLAAGRDLYHREHTTKGTDQ